MMRCLFLMGAHRSGTSWLHQLLDASAEFGSITYLDVLQALHRDDRQLCLEDVEKALGQAGGSRGFDNVAVGLETPEEYGWLLAAKAFDIYTRRPISNTDFLPLQALISSKSQQESLTPWLVLKNPVDFYDGFLTLDRCFPDGFFLFLHRHPLAVFRSQVQSWRNLWEVPNDYLKSLDQDYANVIADPVRLRLARRSLHHPKFLETMLLTLAESFEMHVHREAEMRASSMRLRYEDLCSDPNGELQRISEWLRLQTPLRAPASLAVKQRKLDDDPMIQQVYSAHCQRFQSYCDWLHYDVEGC